MEGVGGELGAAKGFVMRCHLLGRGEPGGRRVAGQAVKRFDWASMCFMMP